MPRPNKLTTRSEYPEPDSAGQPSRLMRWLTPGMPALGALATTGGLMIVLAYVVGGWRITENAQVVHGGSWAQAQTWAALLLQSGVTAVGFLPPVIAASVAHGMAGRRAAVPGLVAGLTAVTIVQGGFLGGLLAGAAAGAVSLALQRVSFPSALGNAWAVLITPVLAAIVGAGVMVGLVGAPLGELTTWLQSKLTTLVFENPPLSGMVLGLMICSDLGGWISKTALTFAIMGVGTGSEPTPLNMSIMAAVMAAGMVPSLAMTLATLVRGRLFTAPERKYAKVSWLIGASFVPEGAVPFAVADPLRVLPAFMAGGAAAGSFAMAFGAAVAVPYGGVFAAGRVGTPLVFAAAVTTGVVLAAGLVLALKSLRPRVVRVGTSTAPTRGSHASLSAAR